MPRRRLGEIRVGDRVEVSNVEARHDLDELIGNVCHIIDEEDASSGVELYGVDFGRYIRGHDCSGYCPRGNGFYVKRENIRRLVRTRQRSQITMSKPVKKASNGKIKLNLSDLKYPGGKSGHDMVNKLSKLIIDNDYSVAIEWELEAKSVSKFQFNYKHTSGAKKFDVPISQDPSTNSKHGGQMAELRMGYINKYSVKEALEKLYEAEQDNVIYENSSCGLHFHIADNVHPIVKSLKYISYMWKMLHQHYGAEMDGERRSHWAKKEYSIHPANHIQQNYSDGDRYYFINFSSLMRHGTIETRIFNSPVNVSDVLERLYHFLLYTTEYIKTMTAKWGDKPVFEITGNYTQDIKKIEDEDFGDVQFGNVIIGDEQRKAIRIIGSFGKTVDIFEQSNRHRGFASKTFDAGRWLDVGNERQINGYKVIK